MSVCDEIFSFGNVEMCDRGFVWYCVIVVLCDGIDMVLCGIVICGIV